MHTYARACVRASVCELLHYFNRVNIHAYSHIYISLIRRSLLYTVYLSPDDAAHYCLYVMLCKDFAPEYYDDNCDEKISHKKILCQYDQSKTGK